MGKTFFIFLMLSCGLAQASEDIRSYDQIIRELSGNQNTASISGSDLRLEDNRFHAAVGAIGSRLSLAGDQGLTSSKTLSGAEIVLGIDLFSRNWLAEGAFRTYRREEYMGTDITLREFDLRVVHERPFTDRGRLRLGAGTSTRYLNFGEAPAEGVDASQTTPAFVALLGYKYNLLPAIYVSADVAYRSSFIDDTSDEGSIDGGLRLGGSF